MAKISADLNKKVKAIKPLRSAKLWSGDVES